jgi:phage shock protein PspC (stress-responsive transcriptional regulator)
MPSAAASMHRSSDIPLVAGVGLRLGRRLGIDPWWVRGGFVAATLLGGFGIPVYVIAWLLLPEEHGVGRRLRTGRAAVEVALGAGLLVAALLLTLRATGFWFSDALTFPAVLVAAGGALIWRTSQSAPPSSPEATTASPRARPQTAERASAPAGPRRSSRARASASRSSSPPRSSSSRRPARSAPRATSRSPRSSSSSRSP